jgi:hypothetical protein
MSDRVVEHTESLLPRLRVEVSSMCTSNLTHDERLAATSDDDPRWSTALASGYHDRRPYAA